MHQSRSGRFSSISRAVHQIIISQVSLSLMNRVFLTGQAPNYSEKISKESSSFQLRLSISTVVLPLFAMGLSIGWVPTPYGERDVQYLYLPRTF